MLRPIAVALAVLVLAAPRAAGADEPLMLWHAYRGAEKDALLRVLAAFEAAGGARVETLAIPHDAYSSKLAAQVPHGQGPDIFIEAHERLGDYASRKIVAPVAVSGRELEAFPEVATSALELDGKLLGLPLSLKCLALYVNTDLVSEVPATIEGVADLRSRLPAGVFPLVYEADVTFFHVPFLTAYGGTMLTDDEQFGFVGDGAARSIELVRSFIAKGAVPEEVAGSQVKELFASGRAAAAISGPWLASDLGDRVPYRVVPLPKVAATGRPMRPYVTIEAAMLTPRAEHRADALAVVRYLAGAESAEIRARVGRQVVARRAPPPSAQGDAFLSAFAEAADRAVPTPSSVRMRSTWVPAERALKKSLRGQADPRAALREAKRRFDDIVRPPPPPASPTPALAVLGLLALGGAFWLFRKAQREALVPALKRSIPAYRWVAHAVLAVGILVLLPIVVGSGISLYAGKPGELTYVGLANFTAILTARGQPLLESGSFYVVLLVTVAWTLLNVLLHVAIGFTLGLLLSRPALALKPAYRVLLILPWAVPSYVTALAWKGMFSKQFGAISAIIAALGGEPFSWWAKFSTAFAANVSTNVWLGFPFMMVVTLGALTAVPKDVLEAAEVDGATRWQRLTRITIPMVLPMMLPAVLLGAIWTFNMFNVVFLVSGGEPDGTTDILVTEAYRWAFTRQARYGYAAAYSVLIFGLLFFGSRMMDRIRREAIA